MPVDQVMDSTSFGWKGSPKVDKQRQFRPQEGKLNIRETKQNIALFKGMQNNLGKLEDAVVDQIVQTFGIIRINNSGLCTENSPVINVLFVLVHSNLSINL